MTYYARKLSSKPRRSGSSSEVERKLPKLDVAGSIPVSRSIFYFQRITSSATRLLLLGFLAACGGPQLAQQSPLDTPDNHYRRGLAYFDRGDMITAQREFERARLLDSDYPGALVGIALVAMERGEFWRARKDVTTAIHRNADFVDAHIALGRIATAEGVERDYATEEWLEEATDAYERAAKRQPITRRPTTTADTLTCWHLTWSGPGRPSPGCWISTGDRWLPGPWLRPSGSR